jgi:H+/Cl- antiporter ClcA
MQGDYSYFGVLIVNDVAPSIIWPVILCGCVCGVLGGLFSRILIEASRHTDGNFYRLREMQPLGWAGLCGLIVAILGVISHGAAHGSGYVFTREMLHGTITETWYYGPIKYFATIFSYLSGVPGGIFAPSLAIGAGIGNDLMPLFGHQVLATAIYVLCMTGFMAAVTQSPITSFIIVMEMVDDHGLVISLMSVALIATYISRIFSPSLYSTLAEIQLVKLKSND